MSYPIDCIAIENLIRERESGERYLHSVSVARTNIALSHRYGEGFDDEVLYAAGLFHDMCRQWPDEKLLSHAREHHLEVEEREWEVPALLHGPVAADILRLRGYGEDLCKAVRWHTLGSPDMGRLALIVFISDYLEPRRKHISEGERASLLDHDSLEGVCLAVLTLQDAYFLRRGRTNAPVTEALERLLREGGRL